MSFGGWEIEIVNLVSPPRKWEIEMLPWTEAQGFGFIILTGSCLIYILRPFSSNHFSLHFSALPGFVISHQAHLWQYSFLLLTFSWGKERKRWPLQHWPGSHQVWPSIRSRGICSGSSRYRTACSQSDNLLHSHKLALKHYLVKKGKIYNKKKVAARRYFFGFHMGMAKPFHGVDLYSESSK